MPRGPVIPPDELARNVAAAAERLRISREQEAARLRKLAQETADAKRKDGE